MMVNPQIIKGNQHGDDRGNLTFNNNFSMLPIKRVYTIENNSLDFIRGWQGHQIEQRWFSVVTGSFRISLIKIDDWKNPAKDLPVLEFILNAENLDVLHVPNGFVSAIQALEDYSKLLLFADYDLNQLQDEFRFPSDYFNDLKINRK